jgi:hypothetical protein
MYLILLKKNYILLKVLYLNPGGLTKCAEYVTVQKSQAIELRPGRQGADTR